MTKAIKAQTKSPQIHYATRGIIQRDRRNYDEAIADFTEAIKLDAHYAEAYYGRGLAQHWKGNYGAAVADYDRALEIVPPIIHAFGARGAAKLAQGKLDEALADLNEAVKADPKNAGNYESLGEVYARLGDAGRARDAWGKALSLSTEAEVRTRLKAKLGGAAKE